MPIGGIGPGPSDPNAPLRDSAVKQFGAAGAGTTKRQVQATPNEPQDQVVKGENPAELAHAEKQFANLVAGVQDLTPEELAAAQTEAGGEIGVEFESESRRKEKEADNYDFLGQAVYSTTTSSG